MWVFGIYLGLTACTMDPSYQDIYVVPAANEPNPAPAATPSDRVSEPADQSLEPDSQRESEQVSPPSYESNRLSPSTSSLGAVLDRFLAQAESAIEQGQWLRAQRALDQAIRLSPRSSRIYKLYARLYDKMGLQDKAQAMQRRSELFE